MIGKLIMTLFVLCPFIAISDVIIVLWKEDLYNHKHFGDGLFLTVSVTCFLLSIELMMLKGIIEVWGL